MFTVSVPDVWPLFASSYAVQVGEDWCEKVVWWLDKQCDAPWQWKGEDLVVLI